MDMRQSGPDRKQMNLHHVLGQESGPMVELQATTHQRFSRQLHGLIEKGRSFWNGPSLNKQNNDFRRDWWKSRADDFKGN
ncbi:Ribonuclease YobL [compost metagenome]